MSAHTFGQPDPTYWMQHTSLDAPTIYTGPSLSDDHNSNYSDFGQAPRQWQQQLYNQAGTPSPQLRTSHNRGLSSSSTSTSFTSVHSPFPVSAPTQYYNTNFDNAYFDSPIDGYSRQHQENHFLKPHHYLPIPTHTPTWAMAAERMSRRRSGIDADPVQAASKTMRPLLVGHSSSTGSFAPEIPSTPRGTSQDQGGEEQYAPTAAASKNIHNNDAMSRKKSRADTLAAARRVPNFDRTMSDIYQDELYNPNAGPAAPAPSKSSKPDMLSPYHRVVHERLNAAHAARDTAASSTSPQSAARPTSPFRQNSPFATALHGYGPIGTAAAVRQAQKAEADAIAYQQHHAPMVDLPPRTISPKDAVLDFHEESYDGPPLFPQSSNVSENSTFDAATPTYGPITGNTAKPTTAQTNNFAFPKQPASANAADYTRYIPPAQFRAINTSTTAASQEQTQDYPAHLVSMDTSRSEASDSPTYDSQSVKQEYGMVKPSNSKADGGSYTCPYSGCTQRFPTPAALQKHKREGHRAAPISAGASSQPPTSAADDSGDESASDASPQSSTPSASVGLHSPTATLPASLRNNSLSMAAAAGNGTHRCDRINPSTGKPCGTVFSRPYDLTRHEDTIHGQRTKVRCAYCAEEKTFSRNDALTRHMRVVHPNVEFAGKHGRRRGAPLELSLIHI